MPAALALRARIALLAAAGTPLRQIGPLVGVSRIVVRDWLDRFRASGLPGLQDQPRPGRPRRCFPEVERPAVHLACTLPAEVGCPLNQWDCTELARQLVVEGLAKAISAATIQRIV
ncbi:MAG: helix-turn-helix domain-containing protein, partial [Dehalococcoidia bacterium]